MRELFLPRADAIRVHEAHPRNRLSLPEVPATANESHHKLERLMEYILYAVLWWLTGFAMFLHVCWLITPVIKVADLLVACVGGLFGPLGVFFYAFADLGQSRFMSKVVYRKRDQ